MIQLENCTITMYTTVAMIKREITKELKDLAKKYPVVTITGPRQSGKTTLVKMAFPKRKYFNLEDPDLSELAIMDPRSFLRQAGENCILDEIQNVPELLSYIQNIVDKENSSGKFILTGSRQFELDAKITQSLAGRTAVLKLLPLSLNELDQIRKYKNIDDYLWNGFYPRIHDKGLNPTKSYRSYFETYIQRDLRQLINIKDLRLFRKFVKLCAGRIGNLFVASNLANEVGVSVTTIQSWLSILEASFIVFLLEPYYENIGKRLIKTPKIYFYDVGLVSYLIGIESSKQIERDPLRGALVENMVLMELVKRRMNKGLDPNLYFYRDNHNNEIDVIFKSANKLLPIEIKSAETFNSGFLKGLEYFSKVFKKRVNKKVLIYTGKTEQNINNTKLSNYRNAYSIL